jgi:lipoprotein NlpD
MWPVDGKLLAGFDDKNKGFDIAGRMGQDIFAAGAGKVMYAGSGIRGYGNLVIVKHNNSLLSAYAQQDNSCERGAVHH